MRVRSLLASPSAQRNLVLLMLLTAAVACWTLILAQIGTDRGMGMAMASPPMGLPAPAFLAIWMTMVIYGAVVVAAPRALPIFAAPAPATAVPGMATSTGSSVMPMNMPGGKAAP